MSKTAYMPRLQVTEDSWVQVTKYKLLRMDLRLQISAFATADKRLKHRISFKVWYSANEQLLYPLFHCDDEYTGQQHTIMHH